MVRHEREVPQPGYPVIGKQISFSFKNQSRQFFVPLLDTSAKDLEHKLNVLRQLRELIGKDLQAWLQRGHYLLANWAVWVNNNGTAEYRGRLQEWLDNFKSLDANLYTLQFENSRFADIFALSERAHFVSGLQLKLDRYRSLVLALGDFPNLKPEGFEIILGMPSREIREELELVDQWRLAVNAEIVAIDHRLRAQPAPA